MVLFWCCAGNGSTMRTSMMVIIRATWLDTTPNLPFCSCVGTKGRWGVYSSLWQLVPSNELVYAPYFLWSFLYSRRRFVIFHLQYSVYLLETIVCACCSAVHCFPFLALIVHVCHFQALSTITRDPTVGWRLAGMWLYFKWSSDKLSLTCACTD